MRYLFWFLAGVAVTHVLLSNGVDLPDRLGRLINMGEAKQLGRDIGHAVKAPSAIPK
jgi:hypothetical protein